MHLSLELTEKCLFHLLEVRFNNFQPSYHKKQLKSTNLRISVEQLKILIKDGQRGTVLKLVIPLNLLKQENVCLNPPSKDCCSREGGTLEYGLWLHSQVETNKDIKTEKKF